LSQSAFADAGSVATTAPGGAFSRASRVHKQAPPNKIGGASVSRPGLGG
jgi:hypothetical protein